MYKIIAMPFSLMNPILKVICVSIILYQTIAIEAKAEGKSISKHHGTDPSESTLIGNAVQHKSKMHHKSSDNQSSRRADINSQGKTGFTSRSIYTTYGQPQVANIIFCKVLPTLCYQLLDSIAISIAFLKFSASDTHI